jgi:FkbM family methyltransferase
VPRSAATPGNVCYLAGLGEDGSLDLALAARGCDVVVLDPTPRAKTYAEQAFQGLGNVQFLPIGLWSSSTTLRFYAPADPSQVSHSVVNLHGTDKWFEAPCRRLSEIVPELRHDRIDLLKLDIEGAELEVLSDLLRSNLRPRAICVEFDQPVPMWRIAHRIWLLRRAGYTAIATERWNVTFVIEDPQFGSAPRSAVPVG